jgi:putative PIN family toxin of toxin-antitoxin system
MTESEPLVADTNIVISRLIFRKSVAARALDRAFHHFDLLVSGQTLGELADVISRPKFDRYVSPAERYAYLQDFQKATTFVGRVRPVAACRDPKDDKFLALALAGGASIILTGDRDLLDLHPFRGIEILTPRQFLDRHAVAAH